LDIALKVHSAAPPQPNGHKKHEKSQRLFLNHKGHEEHQGTVLIGVFVFFVFFVAD
jgi:hypothetical protein